MEFQQIIEKRKSIRTYADTPISQDVLDHILQVGELAPTSRNLKPCTRYVDTEDCRFRVNVNTDFNPTPLDYLQLK